MGTGYTAAEYLVLEKFKEERGGEGLTCYEPWAKSALTMQYRARSPRTCPDTRPCTTLHHALAPSRFIPLAPAPALSFSQAPW